MSSAGQDNCSTGKYTKMDDLLEWIETIQYIENDSNPIQDIISVLSNVLGDQGIRKVIHKGIRCYSQDTDDPNIASSIHQALVSSKLENKKRKADHNDKNMDNNNPLQNQLFRISDVACHIFKYLDLKSRLRCKNVNLLWLYNACNPASYYHLNLNDFIRYNYDCYEHRGEDVYINKKMFIHGEKELTKLIKKSNGNVRKLTLYQWPDDDAELFASMENKFTQLESIEISVNEEEHLREYEYSDLVFNDFLDDNYPTIVCNLLSKNRESIKSIKIFGLRLFPEEVPDTIKNIFGAMEKLLFTKLSCLSIDSSLEILPIDISQPIWRDHCNLRTLILKKVPLDYCFFEDLMQNETLLANVETFVLHTHDEMIPEVIAKMTNIINLDFKYGGDEWFHVLRKMPQASKIKSLTLRGKSITATNVEGTTGDRYQDKCVYDFNKLEKLHIKSDKVQLLQGIFDIVFKSNTISRIQQLIVECSANTLVTRLLNIDDNSRKIALSNLKYIKCKKIRDEQNTQNKDNMIQVMQNITQWLDLLRADKHHVRVFDLGSSEYDGLRNIFELKTDEDEKKLCNFAQTFLKQLINLIKNDNVDCTWYAFTRLRNLYDFGVTIEQMTKLNMVSSNDVKHYTKLNGENEFDCCSLFNERICFEQDAVYLRIITKSKCQLS